MSHNPCYSCREVEADVSMLLCLPVLFLLSSFSSTEPDQGSQRRVRFIVREYWILRSQHLRVFAVLHSLDVNLDALKSRRETTKPLTSCVLTARCVVW